VVIYEGVLVDDINLHPPYDVLHANPCPFRFSSGQVVGYLLPGLLRQLRLLLLQQLQAVQSQSKIGLQFVVVGAAGKHPNFTLVSRLINENKELSSEVIH